jgi:minor extracellular serine protease Vpr
MKRLLAVLVLVSLLAVAIPVSSQGGVQPLEPQTPPPVVYGGDFVDETPDMWFVELASAPAVDGTPPGLLKKEKDSFRGAAAKAGLNFTERYAFDTLWNGLSIKIDPADLGKLARIPGIKALYPVVPVSLPEPTGGEELDLYTALAMTGADVAQSELGYTGAGIKVAVMDTGIDYDHPDLGGCFGSGCRVAYGYDLVGDDFSAGVNDERIPDPYPDDCNGHGTHVAGIVGANGTVTGVAPGVTFGAYRVFGCEGSTWSDIMIEAMEMIHHDHMDVLNMSIGSAFQWPQYPTAVAADKLVERGTVVVASIGNSGANGVYSTGAPGVAEKVIGVASFDNTHVYLPYFEVNGTPIGYVTMTYSGPVPTSDSYEIEYVGEACAALTVDLTGKVALAARGSCAFSVKAVNAINAGAVGVVVHNNVPGVFNGTLGAPIDGVTPVVGISLEDGLFIREQATPTDMTWTDQMVSALSPTGGLISSFSSYGLAPDLSLKPDIGAPGGNIYSTYPLELGGYATLGGTSMSSPHVAGGVALLLEAKPGTKPLAVRDILQNSADPKFWSLAPSYGLLDHVHRQGAGMLDIDDAILATTKIEPAKIAAGEGEAGPYKTMLTIENNGHKGVVYDLSYENALSTGGVITPDFYLSDAYVEFNKTSVTLPPGRTANVQVTIYPATEPKYGLYGGYIVFTPRNNGQVYRVPFAGFVGDYQGIEVLTPTPYGFPWLAILYEGSYYGPVTGPEDWVYTMVGEDIPHFLVHLEHQSQVFTMEVFDAVSGKSMFWAYQDEYMPRNSTATSFYAFPWDGTTTPGKVGKKVFTVPDGDYVVELSILKALGDKNNSEHWEKWTSPVIRIDRP